MKKIVSEFNPLLVPNVKFCFLCTNSRDTLVGLHASSENTCVSGKIKSTKDLGGH